MIHSAIFLAMLLVISIGFPAVYAAHGSSSSGSSSGGCSGDCVPPTLGVDSDNRLRVQGGLSINYMPFDVEYYTQDIPTQILPKGQQAIVILKIFDNGGPTALEHVELHFSPYDEFVSGTFVEKSVAKLVWDGKDGDEVIGIYDDENILQNIAIDAKDENGFNIVSFKFEPIAEFETTSMMTVIWDYKKNSVKNYFVDAIKVTDSAIPVLPHDGNIEDVVPTWIKTSAGWWADEIVTDAEFLGGIEFMIQSEILSFQATNDDEVISEVAEIPNWIKNTAKWWSAGLIPEDDFVRSIQFLINNGVISL